MRGAGQPAPLFWLARKGRVMAMPDPGPGRQLGGCLRPIGAGLLGAICSALASIFLIALMPTFQPGGHAPEFLEPLALFCALVLGAFGAVTRATSKRLERPAL